MVEKLQRTMGNIQSNYQLRSQVVVEESPKNMQEEYLLLHFIPSLQSDRIPVFESSLCRSNVVVQISQHLPHLNFPIVEVPQSSYISGLADSGVRLNLGSFYYHQSVA